MYQIDDTNAASNVPAPPTDNVGTPGWFQGSNAAIGQAATRLRFWWFNCVQGALIGLLQSGGLAQSKTDFSVVPQAVAIIGRRQQLFTISGTFTVPAGVYRLKIRVWGAGGSGGTTVNIAYPGGAGGSGAYGEGYFAVAPGQVLTIVVGQGAAASAGGATSVSNTSGTVISAGGGQVGSAGTNSAAGIGGSGGTAAGGTLNLIGNGGSNAIVSGGAGVEGGRGPPAPMGAGSTAFASGSVSVGFNANAGSFPGGGSSGCTNSTAAGGNGLAIVEY